MWISWAFVLPALVALVVKMVRPDRPLMMSGRAIVFLLVTIILSAGMLTNLTFKSYWGRPRPVVVTQFAGDQQFVAWWDPRGDLCAQLLVLLRRRRDRVLDTSACRAGAAGVAAARLCRRRRCSASPTSGLRMAFGGHFFTDVATAGLVTFIVIWFGYALIYRWPRTRLSDEAVDAALTRLACPPTGSASACFGGKTDPAPSI